MKSIVFFTNRRRKRYHVSEVIICHCWVNSSLRCPLVANKWRCKTHTNYKTNHMRVWLSKWGNVWDLSLTLRIWTCCSPRGRPPCSSCVQSCDPLSPWKQGLRLPERGKLVRPASCFIGFPATKNKRPASPPSTHTSLQTNAGGQGQTSHCGRKYPQPESCRTMRRLQNKPNTWGKWILNACICNSYMHVSLQPLSFQLNIPAAMNSATLSLRLHSDRLSLCPSVSICVVSVFVNLSISD